MANLRGMLNKVLGSAAGRSGGAGTAGGVGHGGAAGGKRSQDEAIGRGVRKLLRRVR